MFFSSFENVFCEVTKGVLGGLRKKRFFLFFYTQYPQNMAKNIHIILFLEAILCDNEDIEYCVFAGVVRCRNV